MTLPPVTYSPDRIQKVFDLPTPVYRNPRSLPYRLDTVSLYVEYPVGAPPGKPGRVERTPGEEYYVTSPEAQRGKVRVHDMLNVIGVFAKAPHLSYWYFFPDSAPAPYVKHFFYPECMDGDNIAAVSVQRVEDTVLRAPDTADNHEIGHEHHILK
jgi:hypothetical protein